MGAGTRDCAATAGAAAPQSETGVPGTIAPDVLGKVEHVGTPPSELAGKRIVIMPCGSRGDVQPFIALGLRLAEEGCRVLMMTNTDHVELVESFGLKATGIFFDCNRQFNAEGFTWRKKTLYDPMDKIREFSPDLIYATTLCYIDGYRCAMQMKVPLVVGSLNTLEFVREYKEASLTFIHWSPAVQATPVALWESCRVTGFLVMGAQQQERRFRDHHPAFGDTSSEVLERFLAAGDPPVYMGWGSIAMMSSAHLVCLAVRSLKESGRRGVILGGWAQLRADMVRGQPDEEELEGYIAGHVCFVPSAPHEWLFPQCVAVVHHGGAGTVAAALRAGVPSIVTPYAADQPANARVVEALGCGVDLGSMEHVTAQRMALAIRRCTEDAALQAACADVRGQLQHEDGSGNTVAEIGRFFRDKVATGAWHSWAQARYGGDKRAFCAGNCGYLKAQWHSTHCCQACAKGYGHGWRCDQVRAIDMAGA